MQTLRNAFRFWVFLFLTGLIGGLLGLLVHAVRPPVYEALVRFPAGIDYVSTGPLREADVDIALNSIGSLLVSNAVLERVSQQGTDEGIAVTTAELKRAVVAERRMSDWELRLRGTDPDRVERLALIWAAQGEAALVEGYHHALEADRLDRVMRALETCLGQAVVAEPAPVPCAPARLADIQADLQAAGEAYRQEKAASRGLSSALTHSPPDTTRISPRAVILGRAAVVLAGALLGFLVGLALVELNFLERWLAPVQKRELKP
jgi:hypothetical protein